MAHGTGRFWGDMSGRPLNTPIIGIAVDPATGGYWLLGADGGIFAFHAPFFGSTGGMRLAAPAAAISAVPGAGGYRVVASDGGVFAFGDARFGGSLAGTGSPAVGITEGAEPAEYVVAQADGALTLLG